MVVKSIPGQTHLLIRAQKRAVPLEVSFNVQHVAPKSSTSEFFVSSSFVVVRYLRHVGASNPIRTDVPPLNHWHVLCIVNFLGCLLIP